MKIKKYRDGEVKVSKAMGYKKHRQELKYRDREPDRRKLWWGDLGWPLGAHQAALSLFLLSLWVKIRTKSSLTNYRNRQNRVNLKKLI